MNKSCKKVIRAFPVFKKYRKIKVVSIMWLMFLFSNSLYASPVAYPVNYTPAELLTALLS